MTTSAHRGSVLSVASEAVPLIKTGGLADVVGALPHALAEEGWAVRTLLPGYRGLPKMLAHARAVWRSDDLFGGPGQVLAGRAGGLDLLMLDAPHLFDRPGGPYVIDGADHPDNALRFAALSRAAAGIAEEGTDEGWRPRILHAHDWQAGLAPAYLRYGGTSDVKSVMTVHNIAFQGISPAADLDILGLPAAEFHSGSLEYWGNISALKAGLVTADKITTVSPTYAEELMRPEFGMGLEGVIAARAADLHGILNGVDTTVWNPATDAANTPYSAQSLKGKAANRVALAAEFGLSVGAGPLAIIVSRLTDQKGIDLVLAILPEFVAAGGTLAVLGSGDPAIEAAVAAEARRFPEKVGLRVGYDEALSHLMFAGGDCVIVPSRFEPCGLTQMYGLRYGTVPLVAATGGLNDTVIAATPASLAADAATGISFAPVDALGLAQAMRRLLRLYADPPVWRALQRRGMRGDLGWSTAARAYARLYRELCA